MKPSGKVKGDTQAVTANRLRDGSVVFRRADGGWSPSIAEAAVAHGKADAEALLAAAERDVCACLVTAPYLIEVTIETGAVRASRYRERIRAEGPSIAYGEDARPHRSPSSPAAIAAREGNT